MGRLLLLFRLVLADVRRHPAHAVMLVVSMTVASAMLSLGGSLHGATAALYRQTRAATSGPDLVVEAPEPAPGPTPDPIVTSALTSLAHVPGVASHAGPYRRYFTSLTLRDVAIRTVVQGVDAAPGAVDHPLVTSGSWVRPGGIVVERGYARAVGAHVGDRVTISGRSLQVVGIAVTAANTVYPWGELGGPDGGPSDGAGLVWMNDPDTRALASANLPVTSAIYLKLRDSTATQAFVETNRSHFPPDSPVPVNFFTWQFIADQDDVLLGASQPILVIGSWLLGLLAVGGVTTLAAGRAAGETRRVGLLKAAGAAPELIAAVLFVEYLALTSLADAAGLVAARLTAPALVNPSDSLIATDAGPTGHVIAVTTVVALAAATLTTLGPTVRALRTDTVAALTGTGHRPQRRIRLTRLSAVLPTPLLLGVRLIARRPGRALLHAWCTSITVAVIVVLLIVFADPRKGYDLGGATLNDLKVEQEHHLLLSVTAALITLAMVNTVTITWTTALETRRTMAVVRTLGATPAQITAGLSIAQLLPTLPGAIAGIPLGVVLIWPFSRGGIHLPSTSRLLTTTLALLLATAALTAIPARIAARRAVARTLNAEAA